MVLSLPYKVLTTILKVSARTVLTSGPCLSLGLGVPDSCQQQPLEFVTRRRVHNPLRREMYSLKIGFLRN